MMVGVPVAKPKCEFIERARLEELEEIKMKEEI